MLVESAWPRELEMLSTVLVMVKLMPWLPHIFLFDAEEKNIQTTLGTHFSSLFGRWTLEMAGGDGSWMPEQVLWRLLFLEGLFSVKKPLLPGYLDDLAFSPPCLEIVQALSLVWLSFCDRDFSKG